MADKLIMRLFSDKTRPVHLGPYPLERLTRREGNPASIVAMPKPPLDFHNSGAPNSINLAMANYQAMMDAIRIGTTHSKQSGCPEDPVERAQHLKAFGYFNDASMVGICALPKNAILQERVRNSDIDRLANQLKNSQTKTLASGIDVIMADLNDSMQTNPGPINDHTHAIAYLYEYPRDPGADEPGSGWIADAQEGRASLRATETAIVIAQYLRLFGFSARAHTRTTTDVNLNIITVAAGLASIEDGHLWNPYISDRFGVAVVTTNFEVAPDKMLAPKAEQQRGQSHGIAWRIGKGFSKNAFNHIPFSRRRFKDGEHPFETLKRVDSPTTYIDEKRVPRVPKRTDMFARALFGDLGPQVQECAKNGHYVRKAAPSMAQRRALGAFILLQDGPHADTINPSAMDPAINSENVKAAAYFLGCDAVGVSRCPEWTWYSHDATGTAIDPPHDQAISIIIDQGFESMEGASGDDWISCAQSMRAYLRFSLLGGVLASHIRSLGYSAKAHTVVDGEVLQPPLLLLSGLGEVSRIGEVILNPYLGPRLKSGVITTTMPLAHDKPIDFGLQNFCENCNKCARECPSGAITAGPKLMFNGYEIWKSDSQKCATYRVSTAGGAMCGRCMKTCPWNLEGLFTEKPFRWAAMKVPKAASLLAKLDDYVDNGQLNATKKWWWDLEWQENGSYQPTSSEVNARPLQKDLHLKYEDQTLAVYPANLAPQPWPFPSPMDREKGIEAYQAMITAEHYNQRLVAGDTEQLAHKYKLEGDAPVLPVVVSLAKKLSNGITLYEFKSPDNTRLPAWSAGAHIDVVVAPEFFRQYSLCGSPSDQQKYQIAVLREDHGKGGSALMHRIFKEGRKLFISRPINHFPLDENASKSFFMGGGIGITPMIAMAHRAYSTNQDFELHYSVTHRESLAFEQMLASCNWAHLAHLHVSDEGTRVDLNKTLSGYQDGFHVYTCGPEKYMECVLDAAASGNYPEEAVHLEFFSVPELPEYTNHVFSVRLARSGQEFSIPEDKSIAEILNEHGHQIQLKCSDGLCGICQCHYLNGEVEHRDFVLSAKQKSNTIILCQSRARVKGETLVLDL